MSTSLRIKLLLSLIISHLHISSLSVRLFKFPHPRVHDRSKFNLTLAEDLFEDRLRQGAIKKEKKKKRKKENIESRRCRYYRSKLARRYCNQPDASRTARWNLQKVYTPLGKRQTFVSLANVGTKRRAWHSRINILMAIPTDLSGNQREIFFFSPYHRVSHRV